MRCPPQSTLFPYTTLFRSAIAKGSGRSPSGSRAVLTASGTTHKMSTGDLRHNNAAVELAVTKYIVTGKDRKSTRLNSSHLGISYAVFCLKKKKKIEDLVIP